MWVSGTPGKSVFHQVLDVAGGADLNQMLRFSDQVRFRRIGADGHIELGVFQIAVLGQGSRVNEGLGEL